MINRERLEKLIEDMRDAMRPYEMNAKTAALLVVDDFIKEQAPERCLKIADLKGSDFLQVNGKGFMPMLHDCTLYAVVKPEKA